MLIEENLHMALILNLEGEGHNLLPMVHYGTVFYEQISSMNQAKVDTEWIQIGTHQYQLANSFRNMQEELLLIIVYLHCDLDI